MRGSKIIKSLLYLGLFILFLQADVKGQEQVNLFTNGDVESVYINQITYESSFATHIEGGESSAPTYWKLSKGASLSNDVKFSGENAIKLSRGEKKVTATIYSDHWKVKDGDMPFGLPLVIDRPVTVSFRYKTSGIKGNEAFSALIKLGAIESLPSNKDSIVLKPTKEWQLVTREITLSELKWGGEITFILPGNEKKKGSVWVDDVRLIQPLDFEKINLVRNHSFEEETQQGTLPLEWRTPIEDEWVGWVGINYRKPVIDKTESVSGNQSLRADVTYGDGSGLTQRIVLNQKEVKPVVIEIWSKLDNSISSYGSYDSYADNYSNITIYIYHDDGTMQEVSPTFMLGETDHDWDLRRFGFQSDKPVKEILLQITVLGTEPTTSLWVDEVNVYELGLGSEELASRGIDVPGRSISSGWGSPLQSSGGSKVEVYNDSENIYLTVPQIHDGDDISIYFNPRTKSTFVNHFRYLFDVIKITSDGKVYKGNTFEKQGYSMDGDFVPAGEYNITNTKKDNTYQLIIPFKSLRMSGVSFDPFGFNIKWTNGDNEVFWNGKAANNRGMGRIILAREPGLRIKNVMFGKRYYNDKDQSQDFITHPQLYTGSNEAEITLTNDGPDSEIEIIVGIKGEKPAGRTLQLKHSEFASVTIPYDVGLEKLTEFIVTVTVNGSERISRTYPIQIPPAIEIMLDQEYYYTEEDTAILEIYNRYRPLPDGGEVSIELMDMSDKKRIRKITQVLEDKKVLIPVDIRGLRVNPLPVQDFSIRVTYYDGRGNELGSDTKYFGKINHTVRRKLPPIEKVEVDDKGRIVINDNFRFFPIVPSVKRQRWDESNDMGANMIRGHLGEGFEPFEERDRAWEKNIYTMTIGPYRLKDVPIFEQIADSLLNHPGFLTLYAKQFYYWHLTLEWINIRKKVERIVGNLSSPRLVIWGHHDASFIYYHKLPEWPVSNPPVGYCYVKVMSRPSLGWRNTPFFTKTEMIFNPKRFKLVEVNYYVSSHCDEIVPDYYSNVGSLRGDEWHSVRNESYLGIIYGATGLYHWVWAQEGQVQRLRGWFQELNYMWPVFVADDAENKVEILPYDSEIDAFLKKWEGKYYLMVANRGESVQKSSVRIAGFEGMKVTKLFELPGDMSVEGNMINDVWKKDDVHVYEIEIEK